MAIIDDHTTRLLLEAVNKPTTRQKKLKKKATGKSTISGGYGTGAPKRDDVSPLKASPEQIWFGAQTKTPPGTDLPTQAMWGYHKNWVNRALEGVTAGSLYSMVDSLAQGVGAGVGSLFGLDPNKSAYWTGKLINNPLVKNPASAAVIEFGVKQAVRTKIAQEYLGGTPTGFFQPGTAEAEMADFFVDVISAKDKPIAGKNRFGRLGQAVAAKLPEIAAMGIDPLDFATELFGANAALKAYSNIAGKSAADAAGAGGYLQKGRSKGIY